MLVGVGTGRRIAAAGSVCVALAVMALTACAPALGVQAHYFAGASFGAPGSGAGDMSLVGQKELGRAGSGVAVNYVTHDVYIADTGNHRVDEFDANGTFVRAFGWGVEDGEEKLEVCTSASGCRAGLSGSRPGELEAPVFVAVDNAPGSESHGDVYVGDASDNLVTKFTAAGALVSSWGNGGLGGTSNGQLNGSSTKAFQRLDGMAVDGSGVLWLFALESLFSFDQEGLSMQTCHFTGTDTNPAGLAIDGTGDIYVGTGFRAIVKMQPDCTFIGRVTPEYYATGVTADLVSNEAYVDAEEGSLIEDIPLATCTPHAIGACAPAQEFGEGTLQAGAGLAVDPGSGVIYVANTTLSQVTVFPSAVTVTTAPADGVQTHDAVLHGTVNPEGLELTKCRFEYGEGEAYDHVASCEEALGSIGSGSSPVPVQVKVEGLAGGAEYRFRLHAGNAHGEIRSEPEVFTTAPVATIAEVGTSALTEEAGGGVSAALGAKVDPNGVAGTTCQIEYGATIGYGTTVACTPSAMSGGASVAISAHLEGLSKATEYHWRVVVGDANGSAQSPDQTFVYLTETPVQRSCENERVRGESDASPSTGLALSLALPDCRAYELVTPPAKNGARIGISNLSPSIAEDGSRVIVSTEQCFADSQSCVIPEGPISQPFLFERGGADWVSEPLAPPASYTEDKASFANADTGLVFYRLADGNGGVEQLDVRQRDGSLRLVGPTSEAPARPAIRNLIVTPDLSHVVFLLDSGMWPSLEGAGAGETPYEYSGYGLSHPELVGVSGGAGSTSLISACGTSVGNAMPGEMSADGRIAYFESAPCATGTGTNVGQPVAARTLYARIDGSRTVLVSGSAPEPQCDAGCQAEPPASAQFEGASEDGARVFFTDTRQLLDEASEDNHNGDGIRACSETAANAPGCNLYELECPGHCANLAERRLIDVSAPAVAGEGPRVRRVVAVSGDGSHVYFVAGGMLTQGANREGREPLESANNLYVYQRDSEHPAGRLRFIATLSNSEEGHQQQAGVANVTPDGRYLVFTSGRGLTMDGTRPEGPAQVYRYDAQSETLLRVSVGEQGFDDNGNAGVGDATIAAARASLKADGRRDPTMSDDGRRVFFQSPVGLTPGALNDVSLKGNRNVLAENLYEWEASGSGGCEEQGGCVALISDGRDLMENGGHATSVVSLMGVDASATNVFFETADQLVTQDSDTQIDIYDARVGGGFPAPAQAAACDVGEALVGEACSHPGSVPGVFGAPLSDAFSGPGNSPRVTSAGSGGPGVRKLTRAQRLAHALAACHVRYRRSGKHGQRVACERQARRRYGPPRRKAPRHDHHSRAVKGGRI